MFLRVVDAYNQGVGNASASNLIFDSINLLPSCKEKIDFLKTVKEIYPKKLVVNRLIELNPTVQVAVLTTFGFSSSVAWPAIPDEFLYTVLSDYIHEFPFKTVLASDKFNQNFKLFLSHLAQTFSRSYLEYPEELSAVGEDIAEELMKVMIDEQLK